MVIKTGAKFLSKEEKNIAAIYANNGDIYD